MPRKTKDERIRELEEEVALYKKQLMEALKKNTELITAEEKSFLHSPTYLQMKEQINFIEKLNELNEHHLAFQKKQTRKLDDAARLIYEDNKRLTAEKANAEYFIGMTDYLGICDYQKKEECIRELIGKVEQRDQAIADRNAEISRLQMLLAEKEMEKQQSDEMKADDAEHSDNEEQLNVSAIFCSRKRTGR